MAILQHAGLLGAQTPTLLVLPPGGVSSAGSEAGDLAAAAGLDLFPWQRMVLEWSLTEGGDGLWSAMEVGLIVARQNGKGKLLEARELAGLALFGEHTILHSAHKFATAKDHFRRMLALIEGCDFLDREVLRVLRSNQEVSIEFRNRSRIQFVAREGGSGRGFGVPLVVLDEAFDIHPDVVGDMIPALSAQENPQVWYASTVPDKVNDRSEHLRRMRARARSEDPGRMAWAEWSSPADVDPDDDDAAAAVNPSFGLTLNREWIEGVERPTMPPEKFLVERFSVWPEDLAMQWVIPASDWVGTTDAAAPQPEPGRVTFALDVNPDRTQATIAASWERADGARHVAVIEARPVATAWIVEKCRTWAAPVMIDPRSPAGSLIGPLEQAGVKIVTVSAAEYGQACGAFHDGITERTIRHDDDDRLTAAVSGARKRPLGDSWAWDRRRTDVDITPLVAVTLAAFGALRPAVAAPIFAY